MGHERCQQAGTGGGADQHGRRLQGVEAGITLGIGGRAHVLHVDAVDRLDLVDQQGEEAGVGEPDDQLVDGPAGAPLQDVDPDNVTAHSPDAAGHLTERAGTIGHPHPDHEGLHATRG